MISAPRWFKVVAVVALLWNLIGCAAFVADLRITPEDLAKLSAAQRAMYEARPWWSVAATGIAVLAGALGCVGLLLGKRWCRPLLFLSLAGVVVQDASLVAINGALASMQSTAMILQGVVLIVAVGLVLLAQRADRNGWLS